MEKNNIIVIDSGNGGRNVCNILEKKFPKENFIMFQDIKNAPYGNKTKKQLLKITINNIKNISKQYKFKIIIFACNTLSTTILPQIKKVFPNIIFLGITPNIKDALNFKGKTLVLSTTSTLKIGKIDSDYKNNKNIRFVGFSNLAKMIDDNLTDLNKLVPFLRKRLSKFKNYNNIVLGCTHFNLITEQLMCVLNKNVKFFDNINNLIENLSFLIKNHN